MSDIQTKVLQWIATGRVGQSSKTMAMTACDMPSSGDYPHDPDDLNRCLIMLLAVPEVRDHFDKIAALGVVWGRLIGRWAEIECSFLDEVGLDWCKARSAPKTYELMQEVIGEEPGVIRLGGVRFKSSI
jgi:hypothetical protein